MPTTKADLHQLVDQLPDGDVAIAGRVLAGLLASAEEDPMLRLLAALPLDDEPLSDEARVAHRAGWEAYKRGEYRILDVPAPSPTKKRSRAQ